MRPPPTRAEPAPCTELPLETLPPALTTESPAQPTEVAAAPSIPAEALTSSPETARASASPAPYSRQSAAVGYRSPPEHTRWKKGAASPNPRGRPAKRRGGKITALMEQKISVRTAAGKRAMTRREALDRKVIELAFRETRFRDLWKQRQERDESLQMKRAEYERHQLAYNSMREANPERAASYDKRREGQMRRRFLEIVFSDDPGLLESISELLQTGAVVSVAGALQMADQLRDALCESPNP